ncbi:S-type pyocin domain-containing protein [Pseudomonas sp. 6D_7.1_Bac1]|uniref:S-type pyocin domain-containing protein n=1 Tax=Pseudomonas sp. 6D_7.1_Bac1 TaxID=2971615 RepID=UPI0021C841AC|nr:S-type pyocin domain-containing protein [Pseudomonas sp. 6D_7.1_Bac1]MCU1748299.1 S-type pyocin domain-containing protein [Pseudomonas sp. 6D_7.1_Bac1]
MQNPPLELQALYIGAQPPPGIDLIGGGFSNDFATIPYSGHFGFHSIVDTTFNTLLAVIQTSEQEYAIRISQLPQTIEHELAATRLEGSTAPLPPADAIIRELGVRHTLLLRKTAEFHGKTAIANSFYGVDPIGRSLHEFHPRASTMGKSVDSAMQAWTASYRAAHDARLLSQTIQLLNQQSVNVQNFLRAVQADDQARMAAEQEAQRVAAQLAHMNAQAEAQTREQARVAALAQAQRLANEQAQVAAEAAARHVAAEQAHLAALAEQVRIAQEAKAREENAAKARAEREAQSARLRSLIASLENAQINRPFPVSGHAAAVGPVFTVAAGNLATSIETNLALKAALRTAVSAVITAATASAGAIIGGFAALLFPSPLANSDLHALSVPLSDLTPDDLHDLHVIAAVNGEIELPVAIGSKAVGNTTEFFVAVTNGTTVPSKVPVRLATRDPDINVYRSYTPDASSTGMTWTPIVEPDNASTTLPKSEPNIFVYNGTTVTAVEGRIDVFPELDLYSFGGFITVFPADSGIPPLYVVFNSPYEGAVVEGEHSGRDFNPEQTGGPVLEMEWRSATASQEGVNMVNLHTSRFLPSDANKVMIDRLERILKGELEITDTDKRFYTHEIRELERFRALGYGDTEMPDADSSVWNNVHTATLEDFKLKDDPSLLYTPNALAAAEEQDKRDYQRFLKEMW